jgi:hypothetical protein
MSYRIEPNTNDMVIDGWEKGIADDPYSGIADIRNMNVVSIPKEASVNFSTTLNSLGSFSGTVASASAGSDTITYTGETGTPVSSMCIVFTGGSLPAGVSAGTQSTSADTNIYWIGNIDTSGKTFKLYTDYNLTSLVDITSSGSGTFATIDMLQPRYNSFDGTYYYIIDSAGRVWGGSRGWVFTGNITRANANGNGLFYYQSSTGVGYLFALRNKRIDYTPTATIAWVYGWNYTTGGSGADAFNSGTGQANIHYAYYLGQNNTVYICDSNYINSLAEVITKVFLPTDTTTYTYTNQALTLPFIEIAQCITELGGSILIGCTQNKVYPWNRSASNYSLPILIADNFGLVSMASAQPNIPKMITVNTNVYIFMGNRGRIYITNGTQAQLYKKVPDHISGTVEPYYTWGAVGFNKNQLYFGVLATTNGGSTNANYGGLWAIDMDSKAMRLVNQLSYGSYAGYCTVFIPLTNNATGSGFYAGWDSGSSTYGIDSTSTPYTNYQSRIDTDNIPIGLFGDARTSAEVEWKLATPLVSGEGIKISYRVKLSDSFTLIWENTTVGSFSDVNDVNWENAQWVQFRIETKSTASSPSYVRLTELRLR